MYTYLSGCVAIIAFAEKFGPAQDDFPEGMP
jgi:hypothetical protein